MTPTMIAIERDRITIHSSIENTWLTQHQIADTFEVFVSAVGSNIRSILKSGILYEDEVCRRERTANGNLTTLYNLEMVAALAFRLKSHKARLFRKWLVRQALKPVVVWKMPDMDTSLN